MASTEILLTIAFVCVVVYYWLKHNYNYWRRHGIPYMEPTPLLGNTKVMFTLSNSFGLHLSDIYNDKRMMDQPVVGIYTLTKPALIIRDLEIMKTILIKDFNKFPNHYASCDPHGDVLGSNNIFFVNNPKWRGIRHKLSPVFTSGKVKQLYPLMQEIGKDLEAHLADFDKKGSSFITEIKEMCALFTTDMIATIAFGLKVNSLKNPNTEFRVEGRKIFDFTFGRAFDFFVAFFIPKLVTLFRVKIFTKSYTKMLRESIDHVMSERERSGNTRNDLIDILVAMKKEAEIGCGGDSLAMDKDFLVAQAAIFFSAGFETSSSTMTFALYELSKHPELQQRLRQEIHETFVKGESVISYDQIQALEYLGMVIDEVLRMYPVMPFLDRQCSIEDGGESFSLKPHCSYKIPDGMAVFIPIFGIHRDPKYWPNPDQFDPERFSPENKRSQTPMTYMPFGTGPRNCIGSRIGLLQTRIGLVHILKNHYVTNCDRTVKEIKFDPKALMLQGNGGIYLKVVYDGLFDKNCKT